VPLTPTYPVRTQRLLLRPLGEDDIEALFSYRSLPDACRYVPFEPMDRATIRERLASFWAATALQAEGEALTLGIELAGSGELVGDIVLFWRSAVDRGGEIGWIVHPDHGGHGYATEAAHAGLHLLFDELGLHRVIARVDTRNDPSARLCERLGMRREAHLVENEWFKGGWSDEYDYALLEHEWRAQHPDGRGSCRWPLAA
jgi:RimJ/RimL family protein N-acetyltransferase